MPCLPATGRVVHVPAMFMVTEADAAAIRAAAIRAAFHEEGELSAIIELRQRFPGITDHAQARACARTHHRRLAAAARSAMLGGAAASWQGTPAQLSRLLGMATRFARSGT